MIYSQFRAFTPSVHLEENNPKKNQDWLTTNHLFSGVTVLTKPQEITLKNKNFIEEFVH